MIVHIFVTEGVTDRGVTEEERSQRGGGSQRGRSHRGGEVPKGQRGVTEGGTTNN